MRLAFIWQGFSGRYGQWQDGLRGAMDIIGATHEVRYFDTTQIHDIYDYQPDMVLYWEAPCTFLGKDRMNYWAVQDLPFKKGLLFAGGNIQEEWLRGFDIFFVESKVDEEAFEQLGKKWKRAFGVNTQIMNPIQQPKIFDGVLQATCASWKRPWLASEGLHEKYLLFGRYQETDRMGFERSIKAGSVVLPEQSAQAVAALLCTAKTCVNTSDVWGGGQRCTLEAMACGIPVVVMADSPKNREFVEESGFGIVAEPNTQDVKRAVYELIEKNLDPKIGVEYVRSKWTSEHYAASIIEGIYSIV